MPEKEVKYYAGKAYYPTDVAPGTINSVLNEYAYQKLLQSIYIEFGKDDGPAPEKFGFSDDFIKRALTEGFLESCGVDPAWCKKARDVAATNDKLYTAKAIDTVVGKAYENRFGKLPDSTSPLTTPAGKPNSPAMMKMYREYIHDLSVFMKARDNGEIKKDAKFKNLSEEFFAPISSPENLQTFFDDVGVPASSRTFDERKNRYGEISRMLKGEQDPNSHETIRPKVITAQTIRGEFKEAPSVSERFAERFLKENSIRGTQAKQSGGKWPPFSNEMLHFLNDPALLDELGFSAAIKEKFQKANLPQIAPEMRERLCKKGNPVPGSTDIDAGIQQLIGQYTGISLPQINRITATDLSIAIGREGKELKCVLDLKNEKQSGSKSLPITESTTVKGIIKRLTDENNRSYGMNKHGIVNRMFYPDDVMETLFHPELIPAAREMAQQEADVTGRGFVSRSGKVYASLGMIVEKWLEAMPENSILFELGLKREMLINGASMMDNNQGLGTYEIASTSLYPEAVWIAASFCMLVQKNYEIGKAEEFWQRLSDGQANSLRNTIGKNCVERAKQYKKDHPDIFPPRQPNEQNAHNNGQHQNGNQGKPRYNKNGYHGGQGGRR